MLCKYVHFEEGTSQNATLVGCFHQLGVESFPATPRFYIYTVLTNAVGNATIKVLIESLETGAELFAQDNIPIKFNSKLGTVQVSIPVKECTFSAGGWYQVTLLVDGDWVAQRRLRLYQT